MFPIDDGIYSVVEDTTKCRFAWVVRVIAENEIEFIKA